MTGIAQSLLPGHGAAATADGGDLAVHAATRRSESIPSVDRAFDAVEEEVEEDREGRCMYSKRRKQPRIATGRPTALAGRPPLTNQIDTPQGYDTLANIATVISQRPTLVVLADSCSRSAAAAAEAALAAVAATAAEVDHHRRHRHPHLARLQCAIARPGDAFVGELREIAQLAPANAKMEMLYTHLGRRPPPVVMVMNPARGDTQFFMMESAGRSGPIDAAEMAAFVAAYRAGSLPQREWKPPSVINGCSRRGGAPRACTR